MFNVSKTGEKTGKNGVILQLFQSAVSPWIIELQAQYLFQNVRVYYALALNQPT